MTSLGVPDAVRAEKQSHDGFFTLADEYISGTNIYFVVTVGGDSGSVDASLERNLTNALTTAANEIELLNASSGRYWVPLMGTGAGALDYSASLSATLSAFGKLRNNLLHQNVNEDRSFPLQTLEIELSLPPEMSDDEEHAAAEQLRVFAGQNSWLMIDFTAIGGDETAQTDTYLETEEAFHHDGPAQEDRLDFAPYVEALRVFLTNRDKTRTPISIAIDGPWGSGKSSFMLMLREALQPSGQDMQRLDYSSAPELLGFWKTTWRLVKAMVLPTKKAKNAPENRQFETAYINLWRVQSAENVAAGIVHQLIQDLTVRHGFDFFIRLGLVRLNRLQLWTHVGEKVAGNIVTLALLAVLIVWTGGAFVTSGFKFESFSGAAEAGGFTLASVLFVKGIITRLTKSPIQFNLGDFIQKPNYAELVGSINEVEQDFQRILQVLKSEGKTLVLFVDDLDRCSPTDTARIVEALNVFFAREGEENCIFILGLHRDLVAANLEIAYGQLVDKVENSELLSAQRPYGRRFLEKLAQLVVRVPQADDGAITRYVSGLSGQAVADIEKAAIEHHRRTRAASEETEHEKIAEDWATEREALIADGVAAEQIDDLQSTIVEQFSRIDAADTLSEDDAQLQKVFALIRPALHGSPRQYKRFFNLFRLNNYVAAATFNHQSMNEADAMLDVAQRTVVSLEYPNIDRLIGEDVRQWAHCKKCAAAAKINEDYDDLDENQLARNAKSMIQENGVLQQLLVLSTSQAEEIQQDEQKL